MSSATRLEAESAAEGDGRKVSLATSALVTKDQNLKLECEGGALMSGTMDLRKRFKRLTRAC